MSVTPIVDDPTRDYGDKVVAVEPGGVEFIPLDERHGRPSQLRGGFFAREPRSRLRLATRYCCGLQLVVD